MKRIILSSTAVILLLLCSCNKLEYVDKGAIDPRLFPKNLKDINAMVNAVYAPLRSAWEAGINARDDTGVMFMKDLQTGVLFGGDNEISLMNYDPTVESVTRIYDDFIKYVGIMTTYIDILQNTEIEGAEDNIKKAIAEIRCARAFLAYQLFTLYGPIVIVPSGVLNDPLSSKPLARATNEEMISFLESDLEAAIEDLPTPEEVEFGKFSAGFARLLLMKVYLYEKDWKRVLDQCDAIIDSHSYSLDPSYISLFNLGGAQASNEVIWGMPVTYDGMPNENQWQMIALPDAYPVVPGYGVIQSSWWFYDTFEPDDVRKTYMVTDFFGSDGIHYTRSNPGAVINYGPAPLKMDEDDARFSEFSGIDLTFYRYPDVLLTKAEAIANMKGSPDNEAMGLLNQIRTRAGLGELLLSDYNTLEKFIDQLLLEKQHEFWAENGDDRDDLIRYGKLVDRITTVTKSTFVSTDKILFPFSLNVINEGKGLFLQNPGY